MTPGSDPIIGMTLGSYEILEAIGQGGMARIYKGFHPELNRYAAIKVVHWGLQEDPEFTDRFRREAQAIATLRHPNIVQIFDFGKHASGYYMAMEFIDGGDLAVLLQQYRGKQEFLPSATIVNITKGVAAALDYAHAHNVIHRDVKPSNVMLNREGHPILTDFGLVMLPAQASQATLGSTFGTPHYVAPEQAISSAAAVPLSDVYALGVVVYEMVTGQVPFDDESPLSVALKHVSDVPPPPTILNPAVSHAVEDVILRVLAKEPADRYSNAIEFARALEMAFNGTTSDAPGTQDMLRAPVLPAGVPAQADVENMTLPNAGTVSPVVTPTGEVLVEEDDRQTTVDREETKMPVWVWLAAVGIVGALIGAGGFFFYDTVATPTPGLTSPVVAVVTEPTDTPTSSPTPTSTPTLTPSPLPTNTSTPTPTNTPTDTPTPSPTPTNTPLPPPPTLTSVPTDTPTPLPTNTPIPLPTPTPESLSGKVLFKTDRAGFVEIYQMNPDGSNQRPMEDFSTYADYEALLPFSPNGNNQIVVRGEGQLDLWWTNLVTGQELRITSTGQPEYDAAWSPVDNRIAYVSEETGNGDIYMLNLDGSAVTRLTDNLEDFDKHPTWSPDGTKIAFWSDMGFAKNRQIWTVDLATGELTSLSDNPFNDWDPVWIP